MYRLLVPILAATGFYASFWGFRQHVRLSDANQIHIADVVPWGIAGSALGALGGLVVCDRQKNQTRQGIQRRLAAASRDLNIPVEQLAVLLHAEQTDES
ncbi:MAG: hypothetical protein AAGA75_17535 [Cyanobacteria bacterium P01_E01_bin.6]